MECVQIRSNLIASAAYYRNTQRLCVWFRSGSSVWHENVPDGVFKNLYEAESPGIYYTNYIRRHAVAQPKKRRGFGKFTKSLAFASVLLAASAALYAGSNFHQTASAETRYQSN